MKIKTKLAIRNNSKLLLILLLIMLIPHILCLHIIVLLSSSLIMLFLDLLSRDLIFFCPCIYGGNGWATNRISKGPQIDHCPILWNQFKGQSSASLFIFCSNSSPNSFSFSSHFPISWPLSSLSSLSPGQPNLCPKNSKILPKIHSKWLKN